MRVHKRIVEVAKPILKNQGLHSALMDPSRIRHWLNSGYSVDLDIMPAIAASVAAPPEFPVSAWKFFDHQIVKAKSSRTAPMPEGQSKSADRPAVHGSQEKKPTLAGVFASLRQQSAGAAQ
jgi:hypothetical protein